MKSKSRLFEPLAQRVAAGDSLRDACRAVSCSESHGGRISRLPQFAQRVAELRTAAADSVAGLLTSSAKSAVEVLIAIANDTEARPADRIQAAGKILANLGPMIELLEIRQRLDRLEAYQLRRIA
jgi:hypothetical protein